MYTFQSSWTEDSPSVVGYTQGCSMNPKEVKTIREAADRFMKHTTVWRVEGVPNSVRVELPFPGIDQKPLYFFVIKRKDTRRFSLILHTESIGIFSTQDTLARLQAILITYGLLLSEDAVIMEENIKIPLHQRIANVAQAIIGIDGIRRLWKTELNRRTNAESQIAGQESHSTNGS